MIADANLYTIYASPRDYPGEFVARRWNWTETNPAGDPLPGPIIARGITLDDVRDQLPAGLTCIGREQADDPSIVETWV